MNPVGPVVTTSGQDEEARLNLKKLRYETVETRRKVQKLGLELKTLRYGAVLETAKAISGPVAVVGLIVSLLIGQEQLRIANEARLEDRFQKEVAHLGSDSSGERLTGVAGLNLILADPLEWRRHREAVSNLVNALAVEEDAVVRGALVDALAQLDPKNPKQVPLVALALDLLVDRNRVLTALHEFSAEELTQEGIEQSASLGPIVASGKVLADLIRKGARKKDMAKIACMACDFSGPAVDLSDANLSGSILANANFSGVNLERANLTDATLTGTHFVAADLSWALLGESLATSSRYDRLQYRSAVVELDKGLFPDFKLAKLRDAKFGTRVLFGRALLRKKNWLGETVDDGGAHFEEADLEGADLTTFQVLILDYTPRFVYLAPRSARWEFWGGTCRPEGKDAMLCSIENQLLEEKDIYSVLANWLARAKNVGKAKLGEDLALAVTTEREARDRE